MRKLPPGGRQLPTWKEMTEGILLQKVAVGEDGGAQYSPRR